MVGIVVPEHLLHHIRYTPAPGFDASRAVFQNGAPIYETAFYGLSGFRIRQQRLAGSGVYLDISDHILPYPLRLPGKSGEIVVIEEGSLGEDRLNPGYAALDAELVRLNTAIYTKQPDRTCCICKTPGGPTPTSSFTYGGDPQKGPLPVTNVKADFYFHCYDPKCKVAVYNLVKQFAAAGNASLGIPPPGVSGLCAASGCMRMDPSGRPNRCCSGCRMIKYCSSICQTADWQRHKVECRGINKERKVAKEELRQRKAEQEQAAQGVAGHV